MGAPSYISSFRSFRGVPQAALFAVALFLVGEMALAIAWRPGVVGEERYARHALSYDYAGSPGFPRLFKEGDYLRYYPTEYADMQAFRIRQIKSANEIRVFILGASVTRAADVPSGRAYPEQLQLILSERHPEFEWQVVNLAAAGFGTSRMLNVMFTMIQYQPDLVIVHPHGTNEYEDERDARYRAELHSGLNGLFLSSRLVVLLKKLQAEEFQLEDGGRAPANAEQLAGQDPANQARWMTTMVENLRQFRCISEERGLPMVYLGRAERDGELYRGETVERLNEPIRGQEHFLDVSGVFIETGSVRATSELFRDWTH